MSILDKLQSIVSIDISKLKTLQLINILSNNKTIKIEYHDSRTVIAFDQSKLLVEKKEKIQELVRDVVKEGGVVLEETAKQRVDDIVVFDRLTHNSKLIEYFKGKIPDQDIEILRAALYVKYVFDKGGSVPELKHDITERYGERGNHIANLCTAGYFTTLIKPLYEEMYSQEGFSLQNFQRRYNVIVTQYTFAVFVNNTMSSEDLVREVIKKIELNKKYGIKNINIHGIGKQNVSKIIDLLNKIKNDINWPPEIDSERGFITVRITF